MWLMEKYKSCFCSLQMLCLEKQVWKLAGKGEQQSSLVRMWGLYHALGFLSDGI